MKAYLKNIAKNVRDRRVALGLSQQQLGKKAGLTGRFISMIETEALEDFRFSRLEGLATALGCNAVDLLGSAPTPSKVKPVLSRRQTIAVPEDAVVGLKVAIKLLGQAIRQSKP